MSAEPLRIRYLVGDDVATAADDPRCRAILSPDEAARASRFRVPGDAHGFVAGRVLARAMLADVVGATPGSLTLRTDARGRPHLAGAGPEGERGPARGVGPGPVPAFSITHTRGLVACAVALAGEVGVDAEHTGRSGDMERLARRYFAQGELAFLDGLPPQERRPGFFVVWTLKEAFLKARGEGISFPLSSFSFDPSKSPPVLTCEAGLEQDPGAWSFACVSLGADHVMAWAWRGMDDAAGAAAPVRIPAQELLDR